jgi:hypothetical protein
MAGKWRESIGQHWVFRAGVTEILAGLTRFSKLKQGKNVRRAGTHPQQAV